MLSPLGADARRGRGSWSSEAAPASPAPRPRAHADHYAQLARVGIDVHVIMAQVCDLLNADAAALFVAERGTGDAVQLRATSGAAGDAFVERIDRVPWALGDPVRGGRPFAGPSSPVLREAVDGAPAALHLPLRYEGRFHGLVTAVRHDGRPYDRSDLGRAQALAAMLSAEAAVRRPAPAVEYAGAPAQGGHERATDDEVGTAQVRPGGARNGARAARDPGPAGEPPRPAAAERGVGADLDATVRRPPVDGPREPRDLAFILAAAHELRSPLAAIAGAAAVLDGAVEPDEQHFVAMIDRNVQRVLRLLGDFMVGTDDAAPAGLRLETVDVRQLLRTAIDDARQGGALRGRQVLLEPGPPVLVRADRQRLGQVFGNLLTNAGAHTPPGGRVVASVDGDDDGACVLIRDSGPGIPAEERARVFERFYRGPDAIARGVPGTGLGLTVVRSIVDAHGGVVDVVPPGDEPGACIRIRLPRGAVREDPVGAAVGSG